MSLNNISIRLAQIALLFSCVATAVQAQETVCAKVKLEIKQELTLERQAFDAEMKIVNSTDADIIENVSVVVRVTDENGTPVTVTDDPNNLSAKFFVRLSHKENIANVDGTGVVGAKKTAVINWLLIPAAGSAGLQVVGKKYLVGATLKYKFGAEDTVLEVAPDVITVKPLPLLTLDYFLTRDVVADDALTAAIEPAEPFTLGVRVKNNGFATAKNVKIDSAQPKIIENEQGLLINFALTGSFLNDAPAAKSLLINFGDVAGKTSKMGRWIMETTLAGKFTEFTARFTHADELGGALTSLLEATKAHFLLRDVRVDLPGRDQVRDFLAEDGDVVRVYESDGADTIVTNRSADATFAVPPGGSSYRLSFPPTAGFAYVRLPDPNAGTKALGTIMRSDAKAIAPENAWLSKTRNEQTKKWEYFVNFFDVNTTGLYDTQFSTPDNTTQPPVLQFIGNHTVMVGKQVSFLVEASSPSGRPVTLSATPLPAGATLTMQAASPTAPTLSRAIFDWTPAPGSEGAHSIEFSATDGALSAKRMSVITVESAPLPAGPAIPSIASPLSGAAFIALTDSLQVQAPSAADGVVNKVQYELYSDESLRELLDSAVVTVPAAPASGPGGVLPASLVRVVWTPAVKLNLNTRYWWRARTFDGTLYSPWTMARFTTDLSNGAPSAFNQTAPIPDAKVDSLTPVLSWTNASVKFDEPVTYNVTVFKNAGMTEVAAQAIGLSADASGITSWTVTPGLTNLVKYFWRVDAARAPGTQVVTTLQPVSAKISAMPRAFTVDTSNRAPSAPLLAGPLGGTIGGANAVLSVQPSTDVEGALLTYVFEIDRVKTFDSVARRASGQVMAGSGNVSWTTPALEQNTRYWWRAKTQDGRAESAWTTGQFTLSDANDAPAVPVLKNPGNGAWSALAQPSLDVTAVKDPESDGVRYQFEVYRDAALTRKVTEGSSDHPSLITPVQLAGKAWHWWRARSIDAQGVASAWSAAASFYVSTGTAQDPTIALTAPAVASVPVTITAADAPPGSAVRKVATIRWEGADLNRQATVSLYYSSSKIGYTGTQIVGGLQQSAGSDTGSYEWDVTAMAPGVYYIYVITSDTRGTARTYAPGAVVIPNATQAGALRVSGPGAFYEAGTGSVTMTWSGASGKPMAVPLLGIGQRPNLLSRSAAATGNIGSTVVVPYLCSKPVAGGFPLQVGPVMTEDLNFAGRTVTGTTAGLVGAASSNAGSETLRICDIRILSEKKVDATMSDYTISARLSTLGLGLKSAVAIPMPTATSNMSTTAATGTLNFGAINGGESGATDSVVVIRATTASQGMPILLNGLKWSVRVSR